MQTNLSRNQLVTLSTRICATSSALAFGITAAWAAKIIPPDRPVLILMMFLWVLAVAVVAGIGAVIGYCQLTTASAFNAGLRAGRTMSYPEPGSTRLTLVE